MSEYIEEWVSPEALAANCAFWKARAEAAEATADRRAALAKETLREIGKENERLEARITELEARLARVPDREAVARALCDVAHKDVAAPGVVTENPFDDPQVREFWLPFADAAITAMQETQNEP